MLIAILSLGTIPNSRRKAIPKWTVSGGSSVGKKTRRSVSPARNRRPSSNCCLTTASCCGWVGQWQRLTISTIRRMPFSSHLGCAASASASHRTAVEDVRLEPTVSQPVCLTRITFVSQPPPPPPRPERLASLDTDTSGVARIILVNIVGSGNNCPGPLALGSLPFPPTSPPPSL